MKWTLLDSIPRFQGFFRLVEYRYRFERFQGGEAEISREVFERGSAAAVLAYDPNADSLVLVEQFRSGAMRQQSPWLVELIAGIVEEGESPAEVVAREAIEEAGCEISNIKQFAHYLVSPGGSTEELTLFAATCDSTAVANYAGLSTEGEDIKVHVVPRVEFIQQMEAGQISNAMTLIAAQWLALNFEKWREAGYETFARDV